MFKGQCKFRCPSIHSLSQSANFWNPLQSLTWMLRFVVHGTYLVLCFRFFSGYKFSLILLSTFVYLHSFFFHNVFSPTMNNESTYRKFLCFLLSWFLRPNFFFFSHELFVNRFSFVLFFLLLALWVLCYYYFFLNLCWRATLWKIF